MNTHSPKPAAKPGRKALTPEQQFERAQQAMELAKQAVRDAEKRRSEIIGAAMRAEAKASPEFNARMQDILRRRVTSPADKAAISKLMGDASAEASDDAGRVAA
jgi:hypothetical protein